MIRQRFPLILICLTFLVLFPFVTHSQIHISGEISGTLVDTTYIVDDSLYVGEGDTLFISPGARLLFMPNVRFASNGSVQAIGTISDSIYFTAFYPDSCWGGFHFRAAFGLGSIFYYSDISKANLGIEIDHGIVRLRNTKIHNNSASSAEYGTYNNIGGVYSNIFIDTLMIDCTITNNEGIGFFSNSNTSIYSTCISYNTHAGIYSTERLSLYDCTISDNNNSGIISEQYLAVISSLIFNNSSDQCGGGIYHYGYEMYINKSVFYNNTSHDGGAIFTLDCSSINKSTFINNIATNNGSALYFYSDYSNYLTNTIVAFNNGAAAIHCDSDEVTYEYNCIYSNVNGAFSGHGPEIIYPSHTNINGDSCDSYSNIILDPCFADNNNDDYSLLECSPCIDAGNPDSLRDIDNSIADIGAIYYNHYKVIDNNSNKVNDGIITIYPNPTNNNISININLEINTRCHIIIYNINGRYMYNNRISINNSSPINVRASEWASGVYILVVKTKYKYEINKFAIIK